ncbi:hypothetical protein [Gluconobacter kondonii]|uniref:hypothetical protein n=1 Tax=Gluconobacter kondonii TaxID=941463 RepID=UPI001B8AE9CC|nr:hypothetical protein [Gluconobacter kondonii]MBS1054999.1 hypothetical protein [Gluconobacter kondonii]
MKKYLLGLLLTTTLKTAHAAPIFTEPSTWNPANTKSVIKSQIGQPNGVAPLDANGLMSAGVSGDISSAPMKISGHSFTTNLDTFMPALSNLKSYTAGSGSTSDASLLDTLVSNSCGETFNVPYGYILPTNSNGGAHFPDTSTCTNHYTWIYNNHIHTTGGTETDFRTPDDLHINYEDGMMSMAKTKLNTGTSDPQMLNLQFINQATSVGPVSSTDPTRQSLEAVELNMQAEAGSTGSLNGFQCDMTDNSTSGDNANVCFSPNVFKYSSIGKDWGASIAGYDYSLTQPKSVVSYSGIENDMQTNGQDMGASLWDSTQGGRHLLWLGANTVQRPSWAASHSYAVGDVIVDANKSWIWVVTTAGTSSTGADPTGAWLPATGSYTDGTVTFTAKIDYHGVVSKAIYVVNDHIDTDFSYFDDVLGVNANVRDSSINLTNEILTQSDGASIRLAKTHPIDFSGAGTVASKNQLIMVARDNVAVGYESYGTGLNIEIPGTVLASFQSTDKSLRTEGIASFGIGNNGSLSSATQAARAGITFGHSKYGSYQTDVIYGMNGLEFTPTNTTGVIQSHPVFELPKLSYADGGTDTIDLDNPARLLQLNKADILALTPAEGTIVNEGTDHVPVIYENGSWHPITISTPYSSTSQVLTSVSFGTPASSTATCTQGQTEMDATYLYSCVATNTWHRVSNGAAW